MSQKDSGENSPKPHEPIKFETIYPIHIRTKDSALAFAPPGDPIVFEEDTATKIALLAHKMNEIIIQMHRVQKAVFTNVKLTQSQQAQFNALTQAVEGLTGVGNGNGEEENNQA